MKKRNLSIIIFQDNKQTRVAIPMTDMSEEDFLKPRESIWFEYPQNGISNPENNITGYVRIMETLDYTSK